MSPFPPPCSQSFNPLLAPSAAHVACSFSKLPACWRHWFAAISLFLLSFAAVQQVHAQISDSEAIEVLQKSGAWKQIAGLDQIMLQGFVEALEQGERKPSDSEKTRFTEAIQEAFAADRMRLAMIKSIGQLLKPEDLKPFRIWFESPLAKRLTSAEEKSGESFKDYEKQRETGKKLFQQANAERKKVIQDLIAASDTVEFATDIALNMSRGIAFGMFKATPGAPLPNEREMKPLYDKMRSEMRREFAVSSVEHDTFTYQSFSDAELRNYTAFYRSEFGKRLNKILADSFNRVLTDSSEEMGRRMVLDSDRARS
jgi:hypothetical protein